MAVNNYAPAEYGGYVSGVESGGGGGGGSAIEFIHYTMTDDELNCSYSDLAGDIENNKLPYFTTDFGDNNGADFGILISLQRFSGSYWAVFGNGDNLAVFLAETNTDNLVAD